jgi:hypothetical protein
MYFLPNQCRFFHIVGLLLCVSSWNLKFGSDLHTPDVMQIKCIIILINVTSLHNNFHFHQHNPFVHKVLTYGTTFNVQWCVKYSKYFNAHARNWVVK